MSTVYEPERIGLLPDPDDDRGSGFDDDLGYGLAASDTVARVEAVTKRFGGAKHGVIALDALSLRVRYGEFVTIVGASGCGKSTLLHLLAGLDSPSAGRVDVQGRAALMFQESALFPWQTIAGNVETAPSPGPSPSEPRCC